MAKAPAKAKSSKKSAANKKKKAQAPTQVKTVHVSFLVDRSGSMNSIRSDVIGGFNGFLREQQAEPGECRLTVHQFDSGGFDTLFDALEISDVREATSADFVPRGMTPLFDAIGKTITHAQMRVDAHPDEQPIVVILTDGAENHSREYSAEAIRNLISAKEKLGWVFTFLGANQDAYLTAESIGISRGSTQNFVADSYGTQAVYSSVSSAIGNARGMASAGTPIASAAFYADTGKAADDDWATRTPKGIEDKPDSDSWSKSKS